MFVKLWHELPLDVLVWLVDRVFVGDKLGVFVGRWLPVVEIEILLTVFVNCELRVGVVVCNELLLGLIVADDVFVVNGLLDPLVEPLVVFDVDIEDVLVLVLTNVFDNIDVLEEDGELVVLLEGTGNLVKDGELDDVFELFNVKVEDDDSDRVLDEVVELVDVFELVVVLLGNEDNDTVWVFLLVNVIRGDNVDVRDIVDVLVDVLESTLLRVSIILLVECDDLIGLFEDVVVFVDVRDGNEVIVFITPTWSPIPVLNIPHNINSLIIILYIITVSFFYIDKCQLRQNGLPVVLKK